MPRYGSTTDPCQPPGERVRVSVVAIVAVSAQDYNAATQPTWEGFVQWQEEFTSAAVLLSP